MKIIYSGRVQGVGFRYFVYSNALKYQISGYVKNLFNGNVELVINDDSRNIKVFLLEIRNGNGYSRILNEESSNYLCNDSIFRIKYGG
ncbi:acylphosphatase [Clostridiaceae bacterium HSG29]|nr:acylphosphatase [Clostridiaceae bacterium HSG29]